MMVDWIIIKNMWKEKHAKLSGEVEEVGGGVGGARWGAVFFNRGGRDRDNVNSRVFFPFFFFVPKVSNT